MANQSQQIQQSPQIQPSNNLLLLFLNSVEKMNALVKLLGGIILCAMSIAVFASVASRYFVNISLTWIDESATFGMAWLCTLGAALATRHGDMSTVTIGVMYLPEKVQKYLRILSCILCLVLFTVLIDSGMKMAIVAKMQRASSIPAMTMLWVYLALPVGFILMFINTVARIIEIITEVKVNKA